MRKISIRIRYKPGVDNDRASGALEGSELRLLAISAFSASQHDRLMMRRQAVGKTISTLLVRENGQDHAVCGVASTFQMF